MKIPLSWLQEYITTSLSPQQIADALTMIGLEVEGIEEEVLDVALTPNLAHCASIYGIARALSAVTGETLQTLPHDSLLSNATSSDRFSLRIEAAEAASLYTCREIKGVTVTSSPSWLQERLQSCGVSSINNIVDITNLVMLERGQPLHAFDADCIEGDTLFVRYAQPGESITTLDGKERTLSDKVVVIADRTRPLAIAGIIGGLHAAVTEKTTHVLLEAAYFAPAAIRRGAQSLGIRSEASYRFERGVDPQGVRAAGERALYWIKELAGGNAISRGIEQQKEKFSPRLLTCRLATINRLLGTQLELREVEALLRRVDLEPTRVESEEITLSVPTYRQDIHQEVDIVEEVAKIYGFNRIHTRKKALFRTGYLSHDPDYLFETRTRELLLGAGLQELLTCDLISPLQEEAVDCYPMRRVIPLLNPRSVERSVMRTSLLPGLLQITKHNLDHGIDTIAGFEVGNVHFCAENRYSASSACALLAVGSKAPMHWSAKTQEVDIFDLKGRIESLFEALHIDTYSFQQASYSTFHPGRQAEVMCCGKRVGSLGEIHPQLLRTYGIEQRVYFSELDLGEMQAYVAPSLRMKPLPVYPASIRDWTVVLPLGISVGRLFTRISQERDPLIESVSLIDLYTHDKLGQSQKNLTFRFVYRDREKTLSISAVEALHLRITNKISEYLQQESV